MQPFSSHDVGVTNVVASKTVVGQGFCLRIEAGILNYEICDETFTVDALANTITIAAQTAILIKRNSVTITFAWNTTGFVKGNYTISAHAWPVPGETYTSDNNFTDGWVVVSMVGDLTGGTPNPWDFVPDGKVAGIDVSVVSRCFGSSPETQLPLIWSANCDVNNNGKVDGTDVAIVSRHFGEAEP